MEKNYANLHSADNVAMTPLLTYLEFPSSESRIQRKPENYHHRVRLVYKEIVTSTNFYDSLGKWSYCNISSNKCNQTKCFLSI